MLLLDEPLGALDLKLRKEMQLELKALQQEVGITFIYVTHDQEEALTMSDMIVVMRDGLIQQLGRPEVLYERPVNRFVANFIGVSNPLPATVVDVRRDGPDGAASRPTAACGSSGRVTDPTPRPGAGDGSRSRSGRSTSGSSRAPTAGDAESRAAGPASTAGSARAPISASRPNTAIQTDGAGELIVRRQNAARGQRRARGSGRAIRSRSAGTRRRTSSSSDEASRGRPGEPGEEEEAR